ncbi:MAG: hypothetical protein QCH96_00800 [Candidatus Thermoplasmatota archaeon]|nr:hypothetical protein [Candidatus Thermoplasmatota archaeon]
MKNQTYSNISLLLAVFGFMLIIATGTDFLLDKNSIPMMVSIIGLSFIIIAMMIKRKINT